MKKAKKIIAGGLLAATMATAPLLTPQTIEDHNIIKRDWNVDHVLQSDGSVLANFSQSQINYYDDGWHSIDPNFTKGVFSFKMDKAPFEVQLPLASDGTAEFVNDNKWDLETDTEITDKPMVMKIRAEGVTKVPGELEYGDLGLGYSQSYVVYKGAYPELGADLIYTVREGVVPELMKIVRFNQKIDHDVDVVFDIDFKDQINIENEGHRVSTEKPIETSEDILITKNGAKERLIDFNEFYLWNDFAEGKKPITVSYEPFDGGYRLVKHIKAEHFSGMSLPLYTDATISVSPDANVETSSFDGYTFRSVTSESFATIRSGTGTGFDDSDTIMQLRMTSHGTTNGQWILLGRMKMLFDTSSIGANSYISSADLKLTTYTVSLDGFGASLALTSATTLSNILNSNLDQNLSSFGSTRLSDNDKTLASMTDDVQFTMPLNLAGKLNINKSGISKIGGRLNFDLDNNPTWAAGEDSRVFFYSADNGSSKPTLSILYFLVQPSKKIMQTM